MIDSERAAVPALPAHVQLIQMCAGAWVSAAVYAAAKLGLADHLAAGPRNAPDLASATGTHAPSLHRFMVMLCRTRAFSRQLLEALLARSHGNCSRRCRSPRIQMISCSTTRSWRKPLWLGFPIGEVSCPTSYAPDASSITFWRSVKYGVGCLSTAAQFRLAKWGVVKSERFPAAKHLVYSTWRQRAN